MSERQKKACGEAKFKLKSLIDNVISSVFQRKWPPLKVVLNPYIDGYAYKCCKGNSLSIELL